MLGRLRLAELRHTRTLNSSGFLCCAVSPRAAITIILRSAFEADVRASSVAIVVRSTSMPALSRAKHEVYGTKRFELRAEYDVLRVEYGVLGTPRAAPGSAMRDWPLPAAQFEGG